MIFFASNVLKKIEVYSKRTGRSWRGWMEFRDLLNVNLIKIDIEATSKEEVIGILVDGLYKEDVLLSRDDFFNDVMMREKISPTGLEDGLAIPHGKSTSVRSPKVAIGRLKNTIDDWESMDENNKVNLVFLIAMPDKGISDIHINVLNRLTTLFMEESFIASLQEANSREKLLSLILQYDNSEEDIDSIRKEDCNWKYSESPRIDILEDIENKEESKGVSVHEQLEIFRKHLLFGTSHIIPFIVAGGVLVSVSAMVDGSGVISDTGILKDIAEMGMAGLVLFTSVLGGYISYSIADKPGLAPGMIGSWIAVQNYKTGFLGAIIVGFLAGFIVNCLKKIRLPYNVRSLGAIFIYPICGTFLICGIVMWVIGTPIAVMMTYLNSWLTSLASSGRLVLGAVLGGMTAFDMGGPVNKVATLFAQTQVGTQPWLMGGVGIAICTPPLGMALATMLAPSKYTEEEKEAGKAAAIMGMVGISEGAIPFAVVDPLRVIPSIVLGGMAGNITGFMMKVVNHAPWGGWIVLPVVDGKLGYVAGTAIGALVTAVTVNTLKKPIKNRIRNKKRDEPILYKNKSMGEGRAEVVAITACPSGVAHTFLAAKSIEKEAINRGIKIKIETQGANGIVNRITREDVASASFLILATDVAIKGMDRFKGMDRISVRTMEAIQNPSRLFK